MTGHIYALRCEETRHIKIGFSKNVKSRFSSIKRVSPTTLTIIGVYSGEVSDERAIHRSLAKHRVNGEWYKPHEDVCRAIEKFVAYTGEVSPVCDQADKYTQIAKGWVSRLQWRASGRGMKRRDFFLLLSSASGAKAGTIEALMSGRLKAISALDYSRIRSAFMAGTQQEIALIQGSIRAAKEMIGEGK